MKLIIDIDKKDFEIMKHNIAVDNPLCPINQKDMVIKIANGTPLDELFEKIRTEIEEYKNRTVFGIGIKDLETGKQVALDNVLGIIDTNTETR